MDSATRFRATTIRPFSGYDDRLSLWGTGESIPESIAEGV